MNYGHNQFSIFLVQYTITELERQLLAEPRSYHTDQEEDRQILYNGVTNIII